MARDPRVEQDAYVDLVLAEVGILEDGTGVARRALESPFASVRGRARLTVARLTGDPGSVSSGSETPDEDSVRQSILDEGRRVLAAIEPGAVAARQALVERLSRRLPSERDERARWAIAWVLSRLGEDGSSALDALAGVTADPNFFVSVRAWEGLARGKPRRELELGSCLDDPAVFWITREAACRTFASWLARGELGRDVAVEVAALLEARKPLATPLTLSFPAAVSVPRRAADPDLLRALLQRSLRNPRALVRVEGRGEFLIEIHAFETPLHALDFASRVIDRAWEGRRIERSDPLGGVLISSGDSTSPLVPEVVPGEILRGSVLSPGELGGGFFVAHLPLPEHYGKLFPWGRVALGMEVVDQLREGDVVTSIRLLDPLGRPILRHPRTHPER